MRTFITGDVDGQLYWELKRTAPDGVVLCTRDDRLDITDAAAVSACLLELRPDVIINAAAYTAVDAAEENPALAHAVNAAGVMHLATTAASIDAWMLNVSTDFVFGESDGAPHATDAPVNPVSVYGQSKLAGEQVLSRLLPNDSLTVRMAWVYSSNGANFVKTMLRLMQERDELGIIADQIGSPTWARSLALALWQACELRPTGILHWTGAGVASWYDFAVAISEEAQALGLLSRDITINPLRTDQYPTPATRPHYSVLELSRSWEALQLQAEHWRVDLRSMLGELV